MFRIVDSQMLVPNIHLLKIEAPDVAAQAQPGQFVILRAEEDGERIPLTLSDWDSEHGTISVIFIVVGNTTSTLSMRKIGQSLPTVVGPLGNPLDIQEFGSVLCLGGCYGVGSIYPIARALKEKKNRVIIALEAKSSYLFYWEDRLKTVADHLIYFTRDGSKGYRGHVNHLTQIIRSFNPPIQRIIVNGCNLLMQLAAEASQPLEIKTMVCLNTIMIDGTGMCGVCRVSIGGETKFACVDGPYFDGHLVDWHELAQRRTTYLREERNQLRSSRSEKLSTFDCT